MKKIAAIILAICMVLSVLCVPAFAANEPAAGTKLRVSAIMYNGSTKVLGDYDDFAEGWNEAMWLAGRAEAMEEQFYERIVVTLYEDWNATNGKFTDDNSAGFDNDTIYIPEYAVVTLNLNNHTINRGLTDDIDDGEVMFINDYADVIIENGTITGGYSNSEGGALYIEGANVTLNNVNIVGNRVYNDDGAGIAMYYGATLTVNGGTFENNKTDASSGTMYYGGAVYASDSTATFNNVVFKNNHCKYYGSAIYVDDCDVVVSKCTFDGNNAAYSVFYAEDSYVNVSDSTFVNSESRYVFQLDSTSMVLNSSVFQSNTVSYILMTEYNNKVYVTDSTFTNNNACVIYAASFGIEEGSFFRNCTFNNTQINKDHNDKPAGSFRGDFTNMPFYDCSFENCNRQYAENMKIENSETSSANAVISVTLLQKDGTTKVIPYDSFDIGWNLAMQAAKTNTYERVIVDLLDHWYADEDGQFTDEFINGDGFNWDAIYIPAGVKVTLNMNGHEINRNLTEVEENGEVMAIGEGADVIINNGTITGGWSESGAGGIHIFAKANVTLNNVRIYKNYAVADDGAGIAMYDGAILTMNGGEFTSNILYSHTSDRAAIDYRCYGIGVYVEDSTATFNDVLFLSNYSSEGRNHGAAIYAEDSNVTINACRFTNNGVWFGPKYPGAYSIVHGDDSTLTVKDSEFVDNGSEQNDDFAIFFGTGDSGVFVLDDSSLYMDNCKFEGNHAYYAISDAADSLIQVTNTTFVNNDYSVLCGNSGTSTDSFFKNCTFNNNSKVESYGDFYDVSTTLTFYECDMGNSSYVECPGLQFVDCGVTGHVGSIFGEGSLSVIISVLALVSSAVSICLTITFQRKKVAPAVAIESKNEEEKEEE